MVVAIGVPQAAVNARVLTGDALLIGGGAAWAATTLIIGASYSLWLVKRVAFGPVTNPEVDHLTDLSAREFLMLGVLAVMVLALGIWPRPLLAVIEPSVQQLLLQILPGKL